MKYTLLIFSIILIIWGFLIYSNVYDNPFVLDDHEGILINDHLKSFTPISYALSAPPETPFAGRPIASFTLALNYYVSGFEVGSYHLFNLLFHITNALLIFLIFTSLSQNNFLSKEKVPNYIPFIIAALWLVHPINSECINYISQRTESLLAMFFLASFYCGIKSVKNAQNSNWMKASLVFCIMAILCKESAITLPFLIVVFLFVFRQDSKKAIWRKHRFFIIALFSTWIIILVLMVYGPRSKTIGADSSVSTLSYLLNQSNIITHYFKNIFWPTSLVLDYGYPQKISFAMVWDKVFLVLFLFIASLLFFIKKPKLGFPLLWFWATLSPTSSIIPINSEVGAERRLYLPLIGLIAFGVLGTYFIIKKNSNKSKKLQIALNIILIGFISLFSFLTFERNKDYRSRISIWESSLTHFPNNYRGNYNLGLAYDLGKQTNKAIIQYKRSLEQAHGYIFPSLALSALQFKIKKIKEAINTLKIGLKSLPNDFRLNGALGLLYQKQNKTKEAIHYLTIACANQKAYPEHFFHLANIYFNLKDYDNSIKVFKQGLKTYPNNYDLNHLAGIFFLQVQELESSIFFFEKAYRLNNKNPSHLYKQAQAYYFHHDYKNAAKMYKRITEVTPQDPQALNALARLYLNQKLTLEKQQLDQIIPLAMKAVKLSKQKSAIILDTLAMGYAQAKDYEKALQTINLAIALAQKEKNQKLEEVFLKHKAEYQKKALLKRP